MQQKEDFFNVVLQAIQFKYLPVWLKLRRIWCYNQECSNDLEVGFLDLIHRLHLHYCAGCYVGHGQVAEQACGRPAQEEVVQTTRRCEGRGEN